MGKVEITNNLGEGRYRVKVLYNTDRIETEIAALEESIPAIDERIIELGSLIEDSIALLNSLQDELNNLITSSKPTGSSNILVTVSDGLATASEPFVLTVTES